MTQTWGAHFLDALDSEGHIRPGRLRDVALALAAYATNDGRGRNGGHVAVLRSWSPAAGMDRCVTDDYGQPYARRNTRILLPRVGGGWTIGTGELAGWLDLDQVPFEGPAKLPEAVEDAL